MVKEVERSDNDLPSEIKTDADTANPQPEAERHKTQPRWLQWSLMVVLGAFGVAVLGASLALITPLWTRVESLNDEFGFTRQDGKDERSPASLWQNFSQYQLRRAMNILILGIEPVSGVAANSVASLSGESDTMLLVRLNPDDKSIRVLSIPRDSMGVIPDLGLTKLSVANARGGSVLAARVLSRTLNNVPIDRHVRISTTAFRELVDRLGGVEIFVPEKVGSQDASGHSFINLSPGKHTLKGEQAEKFARFREQIPGDLARVQRQQLLLKALRDRLTHSAVKPRLPELAPLMGRYVDTNLRREEILALVNFTLNVKPEDFQMYILPGSLSPLSADPNSYWIDWSGQSRLLGYYFGANVGAIPSDIRSLTSLKIAIQNASKQPDVSERMVNKLKSQGFANAYTLPNLSTTQSQTRIIAQRGNQEAALELQKILGLGNIEVAATGDLHSDLTIRIGKDWR